MLQKFTRGLKGKGGSVKKDDVKEGDEVQFVDGPFALVERPTGQVTRVDHRSPSYPYRVKVPHGEAGSMEIPCARWEFVKV